MTHRPSWLYLAIGGVSWPVVKVLFRHRARGVEHVPPSGGVVLAANHWSNFDPWPLAMPFFPRRFFRFMAKAELFWFPLGWIVSACGAFRVRRGEQDEEAFATAIDLARAGSVVVMFPEGTRGYPGQRLRYKVGGAHLAVKTGAMVIPVAHNAGDCWPRDTFIKRPGLITLVFGPPIASGGMTAEALNEKVEAWIESEMRRRFPHQYQSSSAKDR